jgi:hypothetical protein
VDKSTIDAFGMALSGIFLWLVVGKLLSKVDIIPKLYDVRISPRGIEFIALSRLVLYTLEFDNISEVIEGFGGIRYMKR